ncbi:TIGR02302 family protein [Aliiroseovarius sp. PTFE2010]|uniref:TIGR02302 family protein n=1 Tax=Aliiroseovarius sp. PTFE2010 TaxID=3417190 RepID=UPI003CF5269C
MRDDDISNPQVLGTLRWQVRLTWLGLFSERCLRGFWPFASVVMTALAALMLGLQDILPIEVVWGLALISVLGGLGALVYGVRQFRWPSRAEALARLDETLPGRPISAILDEQAIGADDAASRAVWQAHRKRMAARAASARAPKPDMRIAARDPWALRYAALLALTVAVIFGSVLRVGSISNMAPGSGTQIATGPSWEGWIEPPAYTGKPALYLPDLDPGTLQVPVGSTVTLRLYGEIGDLIVNETVSGRIGEVPSAAEPTQSFGVTQAGRLAIEGPGGAAWRVEIAPDGRPQVRLDGPMERAANGELQQPFAASDDYGVVAGRAILTLDLDAVPRRFGYVRNPDPRDDIVLDLPITISGTRADFTETLVENLSEHPWADLPVRLQLTVEDATGQVGTSAPVTVNLPGRRFFDPVAAAIIEERRELLWHADNVDRVSKVLRAIMYQPEDLFKDKGSYLQLRIALRRMEFARDAGTFDSTARDQIAKVLWDIAVGIEDGTLENALERLRQAQDKLAEAIRRGASDDEIAELMQELRQALDEYTRQLAQQAQQDGNQQAQNQQNMQQITGDQLQQMLDRLQQLMEEGRTAEAQALLEQLRQMMENMQVAQGQNGQGQQSPGQQALNGLSETLREQQGLNDETFGDLQEQFGQNSGRQDQQGQGGEQGNQGAQGQGGQAPNGQGGRGQGPDPNGGPADGSGSGSERAEGGSGVGGNEAQSLAGRQQALRQELDRQRGNLPGAGTDEGEAARDALDRAGRAMNEAEQALRDEDFARALDNQSDAMEALREGMRNLADQMAQQQSDQQGQQGQAMGRSGLPQGQDPLGRSSGNAGQVGTEDSLLQGEDVYRRARELLDEIRRRSSDRERPEEELEYLKRLLDRF